MKKTFLLIILSAAIGFQPVAGTASEPETTQSSAPVSVISIDASSPAASSDANTAFVNLPSAIAALPKSDAPVVVELSGTFVLPNKTLVLDERVAGQTPDRPVIIRSKSADNPATIIGGYILPSTGFRNVTDTSVRARLKESVRDQVVEFDLKTVGLTNLAPLPKKFSGWNEMELFVQGERQTLARYPDSGWLEIKKVIDRGVKPIDHATGEWEFGFKGGTFEYGEDAPARWNAETGIWMNGFWCHDWANETLKIATIDKEKKYITSDAVHTYGIGNSSTWHTAKRRYYVFNLLEELDRPGEWYVDREKCILYYLPPQPLPAQPLSASTGSATADSGPNSGPVIVLSVQKQPLIHVRQTKNILLQNLTFKYSTGFAVNVQDCDNVVLDGLNVSNITINGVNLTGGKNCTVKNCEISWIGSTCLRIYGGDRKTLTNCGHRIEHNHLHHSGRLHRTQGHCLNFSGCGIYIGHNEIHDSPYIAISYGGNEHLFEYNNVYCAMMESGDGGGMYTGRDWASQGNVVQYNYFHHFGKPGVDWQKSLGQNPDYEPLKESVMVMGVYLDDCDSGETVRNNVFYRAGWAAFVGGGRYNRIENNLFIECTSALHMDTRGLSRARPGEGTNDGWDLLAKLQNLNWNQSPWKDRYPHLVNIMDDEPKLPLHNVFQRNIAIDCQQWLQFHGGERQIIADRTDFRDNLVFGTVRPQDLQTFPQTPEGKKRVLFNNHAEEEATPTSFGNTPENQLNPDQINAIQTSDTFKTLAPWYKSVPLNKIGRVRPSTPDGR